MRLLAFAAGVVLGAWAGFRLWPRTVAEPARLFSYTDPLTRVNSPSYTMKHPLQ